VAQCDFDFSEFSRVKSLLPDDVVFD